MFRFAAGARPEQRAPDGAIARLQRDAREIKVFPLVYARARGVTPVPAPLGAWPSLTPRITETVATAASG